MEIVNAGYNYRHPSDFCINRPHGSGDYMLLIIKTEAFMFLNGERTIVPPNSAIIFKKGTPQFYGATQDEYVNDWIHFELYNEERMIHDLGISFDTVFPLHEVSEFSNFIKNIFMERYSHNLHKKETMQRYFDLILFKLSEKINDGISEYEHPYYESFCKLRNDIHLFPQSNWNVDEISKRMNLSRSYIQHLYKLFFKSSVTYDVQSSRMDHARFLLSATNMTVSEISRACGYNNDVHFMRIFKKNIKLTPSEFRKKVQVRPEEVRKSKSKNPFSI